MLRPASCRRTNAELYPLTSTAHESTCFAFLCVCTLTGCSPFRLLRRLRSTLRPTPVRTRKLLQSSERTAVIVHA